MDWLVFRARKPRGFGCGQRGQSHECPKPCSQGGGESAGSKQARRFPGEGRDAGTRLQKVRARELKGPCRAH